MTKQRAAWGLAISLLVLVALVLSAFVAKTVATTPCNGSGTLSAWLQFCIPAQGSTDYVDDIANTLRVIDAKFAPNSSASGHQHNGSAGEGPLLGVGAFNISGTPTTNFCITSDGSGGFLWQNCSSALLATDNAWTGLNVWDHLLANSAEKMHMRLTGTASGTYNFGMEFNNGVLGVGGNKVGILMSSSGSGFNNNVGTLFSASGGSNNYPFALEDPVSLFYARFGSGTLTTDRDFFTGDNGGTLCTYSSPCALPNVLVVNDNGGPTLASGTVLPTSGGLPVHTTAVFCLDADGCNLTISESGAITEQDMIIINSPGSASSIIVAEVSGNVELGTTFTGGVTDSLSLTYFNDRWIATSRSDN